MFLLKLSKNIFCDLITMDIFLCLQSLYPKTALWLL